MKRILLAVALGAVCLGAGACKSPLGGANPAPGARSDHARTAAPTGDGDFCATIEAEARRLADRYDDAPAPGEANIDLMMGAGADLAEMYTHIAAVAPPEVKDDFERVAAAMAGALDLDGDALADLTEAMPTIAGYVAENCSGVELPEL